MPLSYSFRLALIHARFQDTFTFAPRSSTTRDRPRGPAGENRSFFPTRDRGSSWIERTYLTLPGWNGGKKGWKRHKRLDYIHIVYIYKALQSSVVARRWETRDLVYHVSRWRVERRIRSSQKSLISARGWEREGRTRAAHYEEWNDFLSLEFLLVSPSFSCGGWRKY